MRFLLPLLIFLLLDFIIMHINFNHTKLLYYVGTIEIRNIKEINLLHYLLTNDY